MMIMICNLYNCGTSLRIIFLASSFICSSFSSSSGSLSLSSSLASSVYATKMYNEFDDDIKMYDTNSLGDGNKDEYGYEDDYYISHWTENNGVDNTHMPPELTDELTTDREIHRDEIPAQSEDDFNTNIVHKNHQSGQVVDIIGDDPDIRIREETRSGRNQGNTYSKANGLQSLGSSSGNSAVLSKNSVIFSISISIIVMSLCSKLR